MAETRTQLMNADAWYNPENWPDWVRWASLPVLPPITAVGFYVIYSIVNSFASEIPTALLAAIAVGMASAVYVASAIIVAPSYRNLVGVVFGSVVVILAVWLLAGTVSGQGHSTNPEWYDILLMVVATVGAITGVGFGFSPELASTTRKPRLLRRVPDIVRWVLALPAGILAFVPILAAELALEYFSHVNTGIILVENYLIMSVAFMAVTTAIVPRGKAIVGIVLAGIWGAFGLLKLVGVATRPFFAKALEAEANRSGGTMYYDPAWLLILQGAAAIVASAVIIIGTREAAKEQRAERFSTTA